LFHLVPKFVSALFPSIVLQYIIKCVFQKFYLPRGTVLLGESHAAFACRHSRDTSNVWESGLQKTSRKPCSKHVKRTIFPSAPTCADDEIWANLATCETTTARTMTRLSFLRHRWNEFWQWSGIFWFKAPVNFDLGKRFAHPHLLDARTPTWKKLGANAQVETMEWYLEAYIVNIPIPAFMWERLFFSQPVSQFLRWPRKNTLFDTFMLAVPFGYLT
jgi:hypothetical protein